MYVIIRTDKEYGPFTVIHDTLQIAEEEARRLAEKHAGESARFTIYELMPAMEVSANIKLETTHYCY